MVTVWLPMIANGKQALMLKVTKSPPKAFFLRARAHAYRGYGYLVTWLPEVYVFEIAYGIRSPKSNQPAHLRRLGYRCLTALGLADCGINNSFQGVAAHE
jgi:hypothetical protein